MPSDARPIGLFDSGVGGLTVFKSVAEQLPGEPLIYFGDTARVPYGTKSPSTVIRYTLECADFLAEKGIKLLVIACNSASAVAIPALEARFNLPVLGVIDAGARAALSATVSGRIGVLGTEATIKSGAYPAALTALNPGLRVLAQPCPLFVPLVEEGWIDDPITQAVAERYLRPLLPPLHFTSCGDRVDTVILGCTHYPLLKEVIRRVLGREIALVDSGDVVARQVEALLTQRGMAAPVGRRPEHDFYVTDLNDRFIRIGERILGRPMGRLAAVAPWEAADPQREVPVGT